jgi:hypothetical protein
MSSHNVMKAPEVVDGEWIAFPGGELEGRRPSVLCGDCRQTRGRAVRGHAAGRTGRAAICFQCYRASVVHEQRLKAAGDLHTASEARFQGALPFEPVNRARLQQLKVERADARAAARAGVGRYVDKRRQAQIAARHALERIVLGLRARQAPKAAVDRAAAEALHAAELQLPDAWLPFVSTR